MTSNFFKLFLMVLFKLKLLPFQRKSHSTLFWQIVVQEKYFLMPIIG